MANQALLYRSNSKFQIVIAFTIAAAIHLSALALGSLRSDVHPTVCPSFSEIEFVEPPSPSAPLELNPLPTPQVHSSSEFVEQTVPQRPPKKPIMTPIRATNVTSRPKMAVGSPKAFALSAPRPEYPYEARSHHITGSGIGLLNVDPGSGSVTNAVMIQSTGNAILDNVATSAFRRWRFKPGTVSEVRIPITFTLTGAQL